MDRRLFIGAAVAAASAFPKAGVSGGAGPSGRADAALAALLDAFWEDDLRQMPERATAFGLDTGSRAEARSRLTDRSTAGRAAWVVDRRERLAKLDAIPEAELSPTWRVHRAVVAYAYRQIADGGFRYRFGERDDYYAPFSPFVVSQLTGVYATVPDFLDSVHPVESVGDADAYLSRLARFGAALDADTAGLHADAAAGVLAPDFALEGALAQLRAMRATPPTKSGLAASLSRRAATANLRGPWGDRAASLVRDVINPAIDRQIGALAALRARARPDAGIWVIPDGEQFYADALAFQTTTNLTPGEVHRLGLDQVAALSSRLEPLLRAQGLSRGGVAAQLAELSRRPDQLYPNTEAGRAALLQALEGQIRDMRSRLSLAFATLPEAPVEIARVPPAIQDGAANGYATDPSLDGSRPGRFYINLKDTAEWPKFSLPTLTYHEALPGHQWESGLALGARDTPLLRRAGLYFSAYGEGWALYAEQLADELGAYDRDPLGRIGYLQSLLFRAARLVVDTGIHSQRWSREKATAYMVEVAGLPPSRAQREVDRYAIWPGQACSYMVGYSEWVRLRRLAQARSGHHFSLALFHDVLRQGGVPMVLLAETIDARFPEGASPAQL